MLSGLVYSERPTRAGAVTHRVAQATEGGRVISPGPTTFESRLAQLIRLTCSDREGEVTAATHALVRTLKAAGTDNIHKLADRIEKPNGSSISEAEMRKLYDAGYAAGVQAAEAKHHGAADFLDEDGKPTWEAVALFVQREKHRLDKKHHEFINKMASYTVYGHEPTERMHKYLHSLFYQLGGKIT